MKAHPDFLSTVPLGTFAATSSNELDIQPGIIFCLRAESEQAKNIKESGYPLTPHFMVHVGVDGTIHLPYPHVKKILDHLKRICVGRDLPDPIAYNWFNKVSKHGEDMSFAQKLLSAAVASIVGKTEERSVESLFTPGGTIALRGEFGGINDFEIIAFLVIMPEVSS